MTRPRRTPAAEQFAALGIPEADWTKAMHLAVKQRWSGLPVTDTVADLRAAIAAVGVELTPSADELKATGYASQRPDDEADAACEKEAARLKRNAGVTAWRARNQLQAALDARDLKFKRLRAGKKATAVPANADGSGPKVAPADA